MFWRFSVSKRTSIPAKIGRASGAANKTSYGGLDFNLFLLPPQPHYSHPNHLAYPQLLNRSNCRLQDSLRLFELTTNHYFGTFTR